MMRQLRQESLALFIVSDLILTLRLLVEGETVWKHVAQVSNSVSPDYDAVEELFCQKTIVKAAVNADEKKKKSDEVRIVTGRCCPL